MATSVPAAVASDPYAALNAKSGSAPKTANDVASADRFLKLLVAQMKNQDPLNPMDNAQVTSQMAQINTVEGVNKLNATVAGLNAQFVKMQALQGAALVGHDVMVEGNQLAVRGGEGAGGFTLNGPADRVVVDIIDRAGRVVESLDLGAKAEGEQVFRWAAGNATDDDGLKFRVTATRGAAAVASQPLMIDTVTAVGTDANGLVVDLKKGGSKPYTEIKKFG